MNQSASPEEFHSVVLPLHERRDHSERTLGYLVSLNGVHGVLASQLDTAAGSIGNDWSVGHLITVVHGESRLVGVVCEMMTANSLWNESGSNIAHVRIEFSGEINDDLVGKPYFRRGIRSYPALGATAHRIRSADLAAIYAFNGDGGVRIGRLSQDESIPATISVNQLLSRHFAVIGSTGVGKTTAVSMLIKKSLEVRNRLRVLIIDPHNEYKNYFADDSIILDSDTLDLPFWMFRFDEMVDIVYGGRTPSEPEGDALFELIKSAKLKFGAAQTQLQAPSLIRRQSAPEGANISADTPVPYRMADALQMLDEWMGKLDQRYPRSDLRSLKHRLESLSRDPRYRFMFGRVTIEDNLAKILARVFRLPIDGAPVTIVQLAGLPNEVVNSVVSVLARLAFDIALWSEGAYEISVICEEAHRYIPNDRTLGFAPTRLAIGRIAKEGRKYGASLGVVSQRPSELDATVLSQCSSLFAMRLSNENDKAIIRSALSEASSSAISFLSSIANREAIAFGEAVPTPMRMKFDDLEWRGASSAISDPTLSAQLERYDMRRIVSRLRGESTGE